MLGRLSISGGILAAIGGVILTLVTLLTLSRCQVDNLNKELGSCQGTKDSLVDAAKDNRNQFEACEVRRKELLQDIRITEQAKEKANEEVRKLELTNEELAAKERKLREELYDDPNCAAVTDLYLCDDIVDSLRRQARGNQD